ncbi:acetylgalactosaminyl-O-glycosyl-glycoprotein beta-1,3-N-acetylglucosaminyltransferase-like [Haemaphysalis longicornis]
MRLRLALLRSRRRRMIALGLLCVASVPFIIRMEWQHYNSHYPRSLCADNGTHVVLAIRTAPDHVEHRQAIRNTLMHVAMRSALPAWEFLFYTGSAPDPVKRHILIEEASNGDDQLVSSFEAKDNNAVEIALDAMRWVVERCAKAQRLRLFVHTNDSLFPDLLSLEEYSHLMTEKETSSIHCKVLEGVHVDRNPEGANFVPRDLFRGPVFPPYCEGDAFIVHGSKLAWLYAASLYTDHYALFPHYVTGHMAAIAEMDHVNISRLVGVADHTRRHKLGKNLSAVIISRLNRSPPAV